MTGDVSTHTRLNLGMRVWERVRVVLAAVGRVQVALLFWVAYVVFWVPVGGLTRCVVDWLHRRAPATSNLWPRPARINDPSHVSQQF